MVLEPESLVKAETFRDDEPSSSGSVSNVTAVADARSCRGENGPLALFPAVASLGSVVGDIVLREMLVFSDMRR